jgi:hypothetical protein
MARICSIEDCPKPTRSRAADLCAMHYHRQYRHGDVNKTAVGKTTRTDQSQYRRVTRKGHPLADKYGRLWEHRANLYDKIGPGEHACYRCGVMLQWARGGPLPQIQTHHLNRDRSDNQPVNIVASCQPCNLDESRLTRAEHLRAEGWWSANDTVGKLGRKLW